MTKLEKNNEKIFNIVREELNRVDPIGVFGESEESLLIDEYDLESQEILPLIKNYTDYKEFAKKICEIFFNTTEINLTPEEFYECAKNILERTKNI